MASGTIQKTVGDGNAGTFTATFLSSDGTGAGNLTPAPTLFDSASVEVLGLVTASPAANTIGDRLKTLHTDLTGGGQHAIVDSSALPTGAATSAKQPALGTAGTPSTDVLTVQGATSMTALKVDGSGVTQPVSGTVTASQATASSLNAQVVGDLAPSASDSGTNPVKTGGVFLTAPATLTTGQRGTTQLDSAQNTKVSLWSGTTAMSVVSTLADGVANAGWGAVNATSRGYLYNGTSWDRYRSIAATFGAAIGVQAVEHAGASSSHIAGAATTTAKSGAGILHSITINTKGAAATATVFDNTAGSGTTLAVIDLTIGQSTLTYDIAFATGLTIVTTGTLSDLTVAYR